MSQKDRVSSQSQPPSTPQPDEGTDPGRQPGELADEQLERASGGAVRRVRTGDEDLEDLEVQR